MSKFPQAATASRVTSYSERVTYHYTADAPWYHPTWPDDRPGYMVESRFTCEHKHKTPGQAEACGARGAARAAASYQRQAEREFPQRPCRIIIHREERIYEPEGEAAPSGTSRYTEPGFIVHCTAHVTHGGTLHRSEELAEAQGWECPWEPFVRAARAA